VLGGKEVWVYKKMMVYLKGADWTVGLFWTVELLECMLFYYYLSGINLTNLFIIKGRSFLVKWDATKFKNKSNKEHSSPFHPHAQSFLKKINKKFHSSSSCSFLIFHSSPLHSSQSCCFFILHKHPPRTNYLPINLTPPHSLRKEFPLMIPTKSWISRPSMIIIINMLSFYNSWKSYMIKLFGL